MSEPALLTEEQVPNCRAVLSLAARRAWRLQLVQGTCTAGAFLLGALYVEFLCDRHLDMPGAVRAVVLVALLAAVIKVVQRALVVPLRRSVEADSLARRIEETYPELNGLFVTAVQLTRPGNPAAQYVSCALLQCVSRQADDVAHEVDVARLFPLGGLRRASAALAVTVCVWLAACLWAPDAVRVWGKRLSLASVPWPKSVELVLVQPRRERILIARGDDVPVEVHISKGRVRQVELVCNWGGVERVELMTGWGEKVFRHTIANVVRPLSFYARGGDSRTPAVEVEVVSRPRVEEIHAEVRYPDYTAVPPQVSRDGTVKALTGSTVSYTAWVRPPVRRASFSFFRSGEKKPSQKEELTPAGEGSRTKLQGTFTVKASGWYSFELESSQGFVNKVQSRYRVRAVPDRIPKVRITEPLGTEECTPEGAVRIKGTVTDDWGIAACALSYRVKKAVDRDPGPATRVPISVPEGAKQAALRHTFDLKALQLEKETSVYWVVEATDRAGGTGRSTEGLIVVVGPEDLRDIVFDRLNSLREDLKGAADLQGRSRRRFLRLKEQVGNAGTLGREALPPVSEVRAEQAALGRRLQEAAQAFRRLRDRMQRNAVGNLAEQKWIGSLGEEVEALKREKADPISEAVAKLAHKIQAGSASPNTLSALIGEQQRIEQNLRDLVDRMTQFGDINQLVRQLEEILEVQQRVRDYTKGLIRSQ